MSIHSSLLAAVPGAWLHMTTDFAPLFVGLVVVVCLGVVACAVALGIYDSCWAPPKDQRSDAPPTVSDLSEAA